jgi:hypothetical protein
MAEITGHEAVLAKLATLGADDGKRITRKGLRAGAKLILVAEGQEAVKHRKSGTMGENLKIRSGGGGKGVVRLKIGAGKKDFVGDAFYTPAVLFGHRVGKRPTTRAGRRALKEGKDTRPFVKGDDFIERAYQQSYGMAIQAASDVILKEIDAIANGKAAG